jgi:hypothetical protein
MRKVPFSLPLKKVQKLSERNSMSKTRYDIFSEKQLIAMSWWHPSSPYNTYDGIICDGAVRSGKTTCMSISFVAWAFYSFDDT